MRLRRFLTAAIWLLAPTFAAAQGQTQRIGNWTAMVPPGSEPSLVALLPSTDSRGMFAIQCFEKEMRWAVQFIAPSVKFDKRSQFKLDLRLPDGSQHSMALMPANDPHMLYAFFDSDKAAAFQTVRWFTIFKNITATITPDFPDQPVKMEFETTGAKDATRLPLQRCSPR